VSKHILTFSFFSSIEFEYPNDTEKAVRELLSKISYSGENVLFVVLITVHYKTVLCRTLGREGVRIL
jgi:hypothetical protein